VLHCVSESSELLNQGAFFFSHLLELFGRFLELNLCKLASRFLIWKLRVRLNPGVCLQRLGLPPTAAKFENSGFLLSAWALSLSISILKLTTDSCSGGGGICFGPSSLKERKKEKNGLPILDLFPRLFLHSFVSLNFPFRPREKLFSLCVQHFP